MHLILDENIGSQYRLNAEISLEPLDLWQLAQLFQQTLPISLQPQCTWMPLDLYCLEAIFVVP